MLIDTLALWVGRTFVWTVAPIALVALAATIDYWLVSVAWNRRKQCHAFRSVFVETLREHYRVCGFCGGQAKRKG